MTRENIIPALSLLRTKFLIDRKDMIDVTDAEQEQNQFLTSSIFSPLGVENNLKSICQNITADSKSDGLAWAVCRIDRANNDLSTTMYLHIRVKTDLSANLEISLRDTKGTRIYWHGRVDSDYRTDANSWQVITLSLSTPTEGDKSIDLSRSDVLEIWAYSKDHPERSVGQINVSEIKLDPGIKKGINEFKKTAQLGQLTVFEPIHFNPPPEFGVLASINIVKDFPQFFEEVNKKRELTHKEGFVLSSQNNQKNLQNLTDTIPTEVVDKYKISNTKYWMRFNQRQGKSSLILSKTFNPEWKVIVGASKEQLSGSFFDDLSLLKAVVLPEENHFVVNGYANLWSFRNDQKQLAIVFLPQVYADLGLKISVFSVIILSLVWGISPVVKKR